MGRSSKWWRRLWQDGIVPIFCGPYVLPWKTYGRGWPAALADWWRRTTRQ